MRRGAKIAIAMILYGLLLVGAGIWAHQSAPAHAEQATNWLVPVAVVMAVGMFVCAAMTLFLEDRQGIGMFGINVGIVLPLLFAGALGWRAWDINAYQSLREDVVAEYENSPAGRVVPQGVVRDTYLKANGVLVDRSYHRDALFVMCGSSVFAFLFLLSVRPAGPERN